MDGDRGFDGRGEAQDDQSNTIEGTSAIQQRLNPDEQRERRYNTRSGDQVISTGRDRSRPQQGDFSFF